MGASTRSRFVADEGLALPRVGPGCGSGWTTAVPRPRSNVGSRRRIAGDRSRLADSRIAPETPSGGKFLHRPPACAAISDNYSHSPDAPAGCRTAFISALNRHPADRQLQSSLRLPPTFLYLDFRYDSTRNLSHSCRAPLPFLTTPANLLTELYVFNEQSVLRITDEGDLSAGA